MTTRLENKSYSFNPIALMVAGVTDFSASWKCPFVVSIIEQPFNQHVITLSLLGYV